MRQARRMLLIFTVLTVLASSALAESGATPRVVATYFHRTLRCQNCLYIESLARYDVTDVMATDLERGQLVWRLVNFEEDVEAFDHYVLGTLEEYLMTASEIDAAGQVSEESQ